MSAAKHISPASVGISAALDNRHAFREGMRDGIPIALGYFAVSFSLGIQMGNIGLSAFQGWLMSALVNASAGEYAELTVMAALGTYLELFIITLVANARYMLMSCALSQRFAPDTPFIHRLLVGFGITDEIFGISIARPGYVNPYYSYGAFVVASPGWSIGTAGDHRRQYPANDRDQRAGRGAFRYVPRDHHPACARKSRGRCSGHCELCGELSFQRAARGFCPFRRHTHDHSDDRHQRCRCAPLPCEAGRSCKGG